jgi:hypothetical protein
MAHIYRHIGRVRNDAPCSSVFSHCHCVLEPAPWPRRRNNARKKRRVFLMWVNEEKLKGSIIAVLFSKPWPSAQGTSIQQ